MISVDAGLPGASNWRLNMTDKYKFLAAGNRIAVIAKELVTLRRSILVLATTVAVTVGSGPFSSAFAFPPPPHPPGGFGGPHPGGFPGGHPPGGFGGHPPGLGPRPGGFPGGAHFGGGNRLYGGGNRFGTGNGGNRFNGGGNGNGNGNTTNRAYSYNGGTAMRRDNLDENR